MNRRRTVLSLWLFVMAGVVYLANGRPIGAGDTLPARYLPFSLLRERNFDLDEFPFLYGNEARQIYPVVDGIPYFLRYRGGHYLSAYSPGPAILATPVYALGALLGATPDSSWAARLEKLSASVITALSAVFVFRALTVLVAHRWAFAIAVVYAFGTSSWSVSSQALWQHGPSQLFLAVVLYCLARGLTSERFLVHASFAMSAAVAMRQTDLLIVLPVAGWIVLTHRHLALRFIASALPVAVAALVYYAFLFTSTPGAGVGTETPLWGLFAQVPLRKGLSGLLVSPSRGLFVYSPVLFFSLFGVLYVWRRGPALFKPLAVGVVLVILMVSKWFLWWGGHSWGPRLLADTMPVLCFFLYPVTGYLDRHQLVKSVFVVLAVLSVGAHALGAFSYDGRWDGLANVGRDESALWSWRRGPLVFYGRETVSALSPFIPLMRRAYPTSADSPQLLAASYSTGPVRSETSTGEWLTLAVTATNTGHAVWLATAPGERGAVRLGWRWLRHGGEVTEGRAALSANVSPGRAARFLARIPSPSMPGDYMLTVDLVSELVTWFGAQGGPAVSARVKVLPRDPTRLVSEMEPADGASPRVSITTDRTSYRRVDRLHLTVDLLNPSRPSKFDAYLVLQRSDGTTWFYDGRELPQPGSWAPWGREFPLPAQATARFTLPLSILTSGVYQWHVVLTDAGTYHGLAAATAGFMVGEPGVR